MPKFKKGQIVFVKDSNIAITIIEADQWLVQDKCWLYLGMSRITNQKVYLKGKDLKA